MSSKRHTSRKKESERSDQVSFELERLYEKTPIGLCMVDDSLRFARINKQLAAINEKPVEEHIGRTIREVLPELAASIEPDSACRSATILSGR